ncbi:MAG TPA: SHOCT domain-containing protein [Actinomycetota bacterium]|nr:SHOCT domain-containing protein [Actinomycetota bacterium]
MIAHWTGWGGGPWFLLFPLFWLTVIVVALVLFRRGRAGWHHQRPGESALAERYARGEISLEDYEQRLAVLRRTER